MRSILFVAFFLFTVGCTKTQVKEALCDSGKTAAAVVAVQIAQELNCSNVEAIKLDIEKKLIDVKICEAAEEKAKSVALIPEYICAPVIEGLFSGAIAQIPSSWGCTGGTLAAEAKAKLIASCSKAL